MDIMPQATNRNSDFGTWGKHAVHFVHICQAVYVKKSDSLFDVEKLISNECELYLLLFHNQILLCLCYCIYFLVNDWQ